MSRRETVLALRSIICASWHHGGNARADITKATGHCRRDPAAGVFPAAGHSRGLAAAGVGKSPAYRRGVPRGVVASTAAHGCPRAADGVLLATVNCRVTRVGPNNVAAATPN